MFRLFTRGKKLRRSSKRLEIAPDEIFLDSGNLPAFDLQQFEGRMERPISQKTVFFTGALFLLIGLFLLSQTWILQVYKGRAYRDLSVRNSLRSSVIFAPRGLIEDRNGVLLVSNIASESHPEYPSRQYTSLEGLAHLLGFVSYPKKDYSGVYFRQEYTGKSGVEGYYESLLAGQNGTRITETNVAGEIQSEIVVRAPRSGMILSLSVDSRLQNKLFELIKNLAAQRGFSGGAAAIMNIENGEMLALTSFPEFDSTVMSEGEDAAAIGRFNADERQPFLDRALDGLYTPGSIVKPFIASAALTERIITPEKSILSIGSISIPNPYNPDKESVFKDWKAHGYVDMREAIAVSSDVYFYTIGGGYEDQNGLGISLIEKYMRSFGFGQTLPNTFFSGKEGVIPSPEWKKKNFNGEAWTIGNTYHTAIGQYGFQVAPIQMARAIAAITDEGTLVVPTLLLDAEHQTERQLLPFTAEHFKVVKEGMRMGVMEGTVKALDVPYVSVAGKTGTAELGAAKQYVNSWVVGFFPYEKPRYAFTVLMEKGPISKTTGASSVMRGMLDWLHTNAPEYFSSDGNASTIEKNKRATSAIDR